MPLLRSLGRVALPLAVLAWTVVPASELDTEQVMERLQSWLDGTRNLECRFVQTMSSGALGSGLEETGELHLSRPGRMRWDYREPERKVALIDGDRTRLYVEEDREMLKGRLDEAGSLLPQLLDGRQPIRELFEGSLLATPARGGGGAYRLQLAPRAGEDSVRQAVLTLHPPEFAISAIEVLDGAGNQMLYAFTELKRNTGLDPAVFEFEPPPGTAVLGSD